MPGTLSDIRHVAGYVFGEACETGMEGNDCVPLISVIVPVFNAEEYLPRCIESILAQTHPDTEIIIINDGSTDKSGEICNGYKAQFKNIRVINQENSGEGAARNAGLDAAEGDWISFVDSDDWIEKDMLEKLLRAAEDNKKMIAVCGHTSLWADGKASTSVSQEIPVAISKTEALTYLLGERYYQGFAWNKLYSRTLINGDKPIRFDEKIHNCLDLLFVSQAMLRAEGLAYVKESLYYYCHRLGSASYSFNEKRLTELTARQKTHELLSPLSDKLKHLSEVYYTRAVLSLIFQASRSGNFKYIPMLRKEARRHGARYFLSGELGIKEKIRSLLIYTAPRLAFRIWRIKKRRHGIDYDFTGNENKHNNTGL